MMKKFARPLGFMIAIAVLLAPTWARQANAEDKTPVTKTSTAEAKKPSPASRYMELGTPRGALGGAQQKAFERSQIKTQIKTFIPPLLRPAVTQHAFVLPSNAFEVSLVQRFVSLDGNDFFAGGDVDPVFRDKEVNRHFTDFSVAFGFELGRKYLREFTIKVNVPYLDTEVKGPVHPAPGSPEFPAPLNTASSQNIGDIGVFLKKKVLDQGNNPFGLAVVGAVFLPTGENREKFGTDGTITVLGPGVQAVFRRFADDGRLPARLQPGDGGFSFLAGAFLTRQFAPGDMPGRSALHVGAAHKFVQEQDGVDAGDTTTAFVSFVKPVYKDYLALDVTLLGVYQEDDEYAGQFVVPGTAALVDRPSFSGGFTGFVLPSLIFSPDPQIRMTFTGAVRVVDPRLGPAPPWILRAGFSAIF